MAGRNVPVVIFPRFTAFVGAGTYWSEPIPVAAYDRLVVNMWNGALIGETGTTPEMVAMFQESTDLVTFTGCTGSSTPVITVAADMQYSETLTKAWFRMGVALAGMAPGVTVWARGFFELRER